MKYLEKNQIEILEKAEQYFYTTLYLNYKSVSPIALNKIVADIYDEYNGIKGKYNWSCNQCVMTLYKNMAKIYFQSKDYWENKALEEEKTNEVANTTIEPKKRGRKSKNN